MRFSRQGYQSGLPFPSPGDLPNPGIKPGSPALQADSLPTELQGRQYIKKQRDHFAGKGPYSQSYGFSDVMYRCESWTLKEFEHWTIHAFEWWCWRRLLRVPWTARRSNQSILKKINPEYSSEGLMLKLKLQYFGYLMQRTDSLEKTLMLGKTEHEKRRGWQSMRWLDGITDSMDGSLTQEDSEGQGSLACCTPWGRKEADMTAHE